MSPAALTRREKAMLKLLVDALHEIQIELNACGEDEVQQHPMLRAKQRFVERAERRIRDWQKGGRA